ncbi:MAG: hypothetical protein U9R25_15220 [Chloroflexota bacterium]|nr:hypothetical protein [Chloroflexota bacterium]
MIRPFGLRDAWQIRQLERIGIWLDIFHCLLLRRSALSMALIAPVPWVGTGLASYVWQPDQSTRGFVQMLRRPHRREADVLFLAPGSNREPDGEKAWVALLTYCIQSAGGQALRRLFVNLPEGSSEIDLLAALSFSVYANEDVLVLNKPPRTTTFPASPRMRARQREDVWWLRRLNSLFTPMPVQHAEGMSETEEPSSVPLIWWERSQQRSYVLANGGDICGGVQLVSGRRGNWLLLHGDPADTGTMTRLVRQGLNTAAVSRWPVYCAVRDYQGGLRAVLQDHGFEPYARRSRLVKHLVARVVAAERKAVPAFAVEQSP